MIGGTSGTAFSAGEAVAPGAMSPTEFSSIPGAAGGQVGGEGIDWMKMLQQGLAGFKGGAGGGSQMALAPMSTSVSPTQAQPIDFNTVVAFLQSILPQGGSSRKGGR